eukprot:6210830-Pleurochrysis_carterae.AAC.1
MEEGCLQGRCSIINLGRLKKIVAAHPCEEPSESTNAPRSHHQIDLDAPGRVHRHRPCFGSPRNEKRE